MNKVNLVWMKHITVPGISKNDQVQVKTHGGATTDDIIDYINTFPAKGFSETRPFMHSSKHVFGSQ